jgi:predicted P-loop ATPase
MRISDALVSKVIQTIARERPCHPVREYLRSLKWDGIGRLDDSGSRA